MKIIDAIIKNSKESRKEHLLHCFITEGKKSSSNVKYKFGEHEKHPVLLDKTEMYNQKLHYIHQNPVTARFISESWHWLYSSAIDYHTAKKGRLDIIILDGFGFAKISNKETQGWSPAPGGVTGKVVLVHRDNSQSPTQKIVEFVYDEAGQRIMKKTYASASPYQLISVTYYVDDIIYTQTVTGGISYGAVTPIEYPIEGATGRIGIYYKSLATPVYAYQLTDHLGNVRAVLAYDGTTTQVRMYTDYYPFGMTLGFYGPLDDARYGYQGNYAEKDGEINWNAFELRMYNSRIGRWLQFDPKNVGNSPYIGMGNNPVSSVDPDVGSPLTTIVDKFNRILNVILDGKTDIIRLNNVDYDEWSDYLSRYGGNRFNDQARESGELLSDHTLTDNAFMLTDEENGGFVRPKFGVWVGASQIPGYEGGWTGKQIMGSINDKFRLLSSVMSEPFAMGALAVLSRFGGPFDVKNSLSEGFVDGQYTSVRWDDNTLAPLKQVGNITFGKNMDIARSWYHSKAATWNIYMRVVGEYNQIHAHGNGYNSGYPYFGEHSYSGAAMSFGYWGHW